jgi:hypothetical protein
MQPQHTRRHQVMEGSIAGGCGHGRQDMGVNGDAIRSDADFEVYAMKYKAYIQQQKSVMMQHHQKHSK